MPEFTAEERQRIYEEEKVRQDARRRLEEAEKAAQQARAYKRSWIIAAVIFAPILLLMVIGASMPPDTGPSDMEKAAIAAVQNHVNPTGETILQRAQAALTVAGRSGTFLQVDGWIAVREEGSRWWVAFLLKESGQKKQAEWTVDLDTKEVKAKNQLGYSLMY